MNNIVIIQENSSDSEQLLGAIEAHALPSKIDVLKTGEEALFYFESDEHLETDLILLDLDLAGPMGLTLLEIFQDEPLLNPIPKIVFTESREESSVIQAWNAGCSGYFQKPEDADSYRTFVDSIFQYWLSPQKLSRRKVTQDYVKSHLLTPQQATTDANAPVANSA